CLRAGRLRQRDDRNHGAGGIGLMASLGGGLGSQRGELSLMADVNVTSLVDVMLVLLIIFMITAPIMQGGVDVELPRAEARPLSPKEGMVVTVNRDGRIFIDQTPVSYTDFRVTFRSLVATRKPTGVYLQADARVPYGEVVRVLAVIRTAGVQNVGLVAAEEESS
ncbi:MAG: ExbD/TolR family protein, partial [Gemmatimonadales bacterium]